MKHKNEIGIFTVHHVRKNQKRVFLFSFLSVLCVNLSSVLFNETDDTEEKKTREAERERSDICVRVYIDGRTQCVCS